MAKGEQAVASSDEFALIRGWTANRQPSDLLSRTGVLAGIGDDAAVVASPAGRDLLLAMDTMVEEIHFLPETMGDADVGFKSLAANVSDIAAMGGEPLHALVSVSVPPSWGPKRMQRLYDGLYACAEIYGVAVVGGDTTSSKTHLVVTVALTGSSLSGKALKRSGAEPDQLVFVTGPTGLSAGGLYGLLPRAGLSPVPAPPERLVRAHRRPSPSVKAGRLLADNSWGTSLNDVSDGLASEAWEIAEASGLRLVLQETALPLSGELAAYAAVCGKNPLDWVLYGGEDYVLLGTASRFDESAMKGAFREEGIPFFVIGETEAGEAGVWLETAGKRKPLVKGGYNHFVKG
jgi:thiamine-monophosphate kinase